LSCDLDDLAAGANLGEDVAFEVRAVAQRPVSRGGGGDDDDC